MNRLLLVVCAAAALAASAMTGAAAAPAASSESIVSALAAKAPGLRPHVLQLALDASRTAASRGLVTRTDLLTVIDYSLPSSEPRLFVFDLDSRKLLFRELVAHGKNSGGNRTSEFSNRHGSLQTSLGLFSTAGTYAGGNGYSLRLRGLEQGVNDQAWDRLIVMHGAPYVSTSTVKALGRLGRSWGCPAVRPAVARKLIDTIRGGSAVFAYYPDQEWLEASAFLPKPASAGAIAASR